MTRGEKAISILSLVIGLFGSCLALYDHLVLGERIANLERHRLTGLFSVDQPVPGSQLKAKTLINLEGTFVDAIPDGLQPRAVFQNDNSYYVSRTPLHHSNRQWSLSFMPWPGHWKVHICLTDKNGEVELERWAAERTPDGETNWNNPRSKLPKGVSINTTFEYEALETQDNTSQANQ